MNPGSYYKLPSQVLSTAITPTKASDPLIYSWYTFGQTNSYYVYLHFAEIKNLQANESRAFDIFLNGKLFYGPIVLGYLNATTIYSTSPLAALTDLAGNYTFSLVKRGNSTLPPILNAIEIYTTLDLSQWETNQDDGVLFNLV